MMHFDVIFFDAVASRYYDRMILEKNALGGTEATVIRIAEGLASLGLKVAVVEANPNINYFEPVMGQFCFFLHGDDIQKMTCKHYIQLRRNYFPQLFKGAKKYIWLHDVASDEKEWVPSLQEYNIKLICVSRWHKNNIYEETKYDNITYVYNPILDQIYFSPDQTAEVNKNILVWMSSPHKGLGHALQLFKEMRDENPQLQLIVFNPGYLQLDVSRLATQPGVNLYGGIPSINMWNIVRKALCAFYPVQYDETFGMVAAEANALGTPMATFPRAALKEVISSDNQFANSDAEIKRKVLDWVKNGRPIVVGKDEFKFSNVIMDWVKLLAK